MNDRNYKFLEEEKVADSFKKFPGRLVGKKQNDKRDPGEVLAYLRHHGAFGSIASFTGMASTINSKIKAKNGAKNLYPKYIEWCAKHDVKPSNEETFMKIAKLYYNDRLVGKSTRFAGNAIDMVNVSRDLGKYNKIQNRTKKWIIPTLAVGSGIDLVDSVGRNERVLSKLKEDYMDGYLEAYFDFTND